jgi:hypothetical protein
LSQSIEGTSANDDPESENERIANWKASFPWKPTHDPKVNFDPTRHLSGNEMRSDATMTDKRTGANHLILRRFFSDEARFTPQFQKFYHILREHDRGHDPVAVAAAFFCLRRYFNAAYEHASDELIHRDDPNWKWAKTWGEQAEKSFDFLHTGLVRSQWHRSGFRTEGGKAEAYGLIEKLLSELNGLGELPVDVMSYAITGGMHSSNPEAAALLAGEEELLVPYDGWTEENEILEAERKRQFEISFKQGDPSLKEVAPELFPPAGIENGQLVDMHGVPVKWSDGTEVSLINERGERVPVVVEDDGSISLPTPQEVELMRQNGDVRPATLDEASPIIQKIMEMSQPPK